MKNKGFTIIELIVVIAIIAILASIILVSVQQYIKRSKDAAIKANISELITAGSGYYSNNGNYGSFCDSSSVTATNDAVFKLNSVGYFTCGYGGESMLPPNRWCAAAKLLNGKIFCVDSSGLKIEISGDLPSNFCMDSYSELGGKCNTESP